MVHRHLPDLPGTGRDRNILSDAGDILAIPRELKVDMVLSGHRHVPYVNNVSNTLIIHCGTVSSIVKQEEGGKRHDAAESR